jgi:probable rRNA maturation factor
MIQNRQRRVPLSLASLDGFLARVCQRVDLPSDAVGVCFVSDAAIARWNEAYRGKHGPTDVLSFPADGSIARNGGSGAGGKKTGKLPRHVESAREQNRRKTLSRRVAANIKLEDAASSYLGDIAISPQTAQRNARRFGRTLPQELRILLLHGVLHLMGYDHETDHGEMERRERQLRQELGLVS